MTEKITVTRLHRGDGGLFGAHGEFRIAQCWKVRLGGEETDFRVVRGASPNPFLTVVDDRGRMITSWHAGISPGDLARLRSVSAKVRGVAVREG